MSPINLPGRNRQAQAEAIAQAAPMTRLEERRDELREKFAELQWDLGGAAYEMAARDYYRLDVLAGLASRLQVVDAELAEIERMARLEKAGASGSCSGCGSLHARGAIYCWRCGRNLTDADRTVVGPSAAGQIVIEQPPAPAPNPPVATNGAMPKEAPLMAQEPPTVDQPPKDDPPLMADEPPLAAPDQRSDVPEPPTAVPDPPVLIPNPPASEPAVSLSEPAAPAPEPLDPLPPSPVPTEPLPPAAAPAAPVPPAQAPDAPDAPPGTPEAVPEMRV